MLVMRGSVTQATIGGVSGGGAANTSSRAASGASLRRSHASPTRNAMAPIRSASPILSGSARYTSRQDSWLPGRSVQRGWAVRHRVVRCQDRRVLPRLWGWSCRPRHDGFGADTDEIGWRHDVGARQRCHGSRRQAILLVWHRSAARLAARVARRCLPEMYQRAAWALCSAIADRALPHDTVNPLATSSPPRSVVSL
jgi:hypothetical protein